MKITTKAPECIKRCIPYFLYFLLILTLIETSPRINAAGNGSQNTAISSPKSRGRPFSGTIKTVDYKEGWIVLQGRAAQTFYVTTNTVIKVDGSPASLKDVTVGVYVGGYAREDFAGRWIASTLNLNTSRKKSSSTK